jgi:hypothetical protein
MSNMEDLNELLKVNYEVTVNNIDNYEIYWRKL